jgi:hypothetical protein
MCGCKLVTPRLSRSSSDRFGEVDRNAPGFVARQEIGRQAVRRSDMSGIGGEAEARGLRLKRR